MSQIFHLPSLDKQDTWYPTLRKTVWVLSQLHDFVKVHCPPALGLFLTENISQPVIFEDIAQETVSLCRQSLVAAGDMLKMRNPPTSHLDAQLFLVRHLLILKEITQNLDLGQRDVDTNINFSGVTGRFAGPIS